MKVARNEKRKKLPKFSFYINIGNFEAFLWNLNLSTNRLFWRCERLSFSTYVTNYKFSKYTTYNDIIGGIYEQDTFYTIADELGIMIWQDFMFACSMYQANDVIRASVEEEVRHQVNEHVLDDENLFILYELILGLDIISIDDNSLCTVLLCDGTI